MCSRQSWNLDLLSGESSLRIVNVPKSELRHPVWMINMFIWLVSYVFSQLCIQSVCAYALSQYSTISTQPVCAYALSQYSTISTQPVCAYALS